MQKKFNDETDILALDFDGVIGDSIQECLVNGHNAWQEYLGANRPVQRLEELPRPRESIRLRNFIRTGEDYAYIAMALFMDETLQGQADFDAYKAEHAGLAEVLESLFYGNRARLAQHNLDAWLALNPLFDGMEAFLKSGFPAERLFLISSKRSEYIEKILEGHGISFEKSHIFYAGMEKTKREIISDLLYDNKWPAEQFHFVEDQVDHLIKTNPLGIHRWLAGWGYNNDEQKAVATENGIPILTLDNFKTLFHPA